MSTSTCFRADRSTMGRCHNWQIPSLYSPIKFSPGSAKNCFVNFQRAEGPSRFVRPPLENKQGKKKEKSMPASRRGEDDVCPKRSLHACVRRVCGFMPAHYSSLPLTGNYAEWKLSLPKWASIVCRLSIPLCCHIQPIRFRETEIIARRIETAIPAPFNRSSCAKRWKTLETPKRSLRFGCSIFSHRRDVATGSRKTATRSTNMVEDWRACLELDVNFQRWEPARLFSQSPVSRMILENW